MKRDLAPSLFVAAGIVFSTLLAAVLHGWLVLAGPVVLAIAVLGANVWQSQSRRPSAAAIVLAAACIVASVIVALDNPAGVKLLLPTMGVAAWVAMVPPFGARHRTCRGV